MNVPARICIILILAAGFAARGAEPSPTKVIAGAIAHTERSDQDRARDATSKPAQIMAFFGIAERMTILDLFSGGGYWAELFAHVVGKDGRIVAHTNAAYRNFSGKEADARLAGGRLSNVEVLHSEFDDLKLGRNRYDLIFIGLGYHDIYFHAPFWAQPGRDHFFGQLMTALKAGGTLAIIDHAAARGTRAAHAGTLHRIDEAFARTDIERAGFAFVKATDALRNPEDDHTLEVFDDTVRRQTDRFVYFFRKP